MRTLRNISIMALAVVLIAFAITTAETFRQGRPSEPTFSPSATVTKTANYTITSADSYVRFTASTTGLTATLPSISSLRASFGAKSYKILKTDNTGLAITVTPATGDTIGGESYRKIFAQNGYIIISTGPGSDWTVVYESPYTAEDYEAGTVTTSALDIQPQMYYSALTASTTLTRAYAGQMLISSGTRLMHALPSAAACPGCVFMLVSGDTNTVSIDPNGTDQILINTAAAGSRLIDTAAAGNMLQLVSTGTTSWIVTRLTGSWLDNP